MSLEIVFLSFQFLLFLCQKRINHTTNNVFEIDQLMRNVLQVICDVSFFFIHENITTSHVYELLFKDSLGKALYSSQLFLPNYITPYIYDVLKTVLFSERKL